MLISRIVNWKAAKALGIEILSMLLVGVGEVIDWEGSLPPKSVAQIHSDNGPVTITVDRPAEV